MSRVTDVLAELESIGAVGDKVLLLRMETPKVVPELRAVPANLASLDEQLAAQQARFDEERHQWAVLVEIAGTKLEALAAELARLGAPGEALGRLAMQQQQAEAQAASGYITPWAIKPEVPPVEAWRGAPGRRA